MGLFASIAEQRGTWVGPYSSKDPALARLFSDGARTLAGPVVSEATALSVSAFYSGVNQIASDIAKLPLNLRKIRDGGGSDPYTESKLYKLLKFSPNPETRSMMFRQTITAHALIYEKGGFAEIVRDQLGRPSALWIIHPTQIEPFYDENGIVDGRKSPLRYKVNGGRTILEASDVLHIHGLSDDGVSGFGLVRIAREALGLALASQQFASAFFGNGTRFGGVLASDGDLDDTQAEEIRTRIEALHARADRAFRLLVLGAGFKYTQAGTNPTDAQMTELRNQQVEEVARFLNMPLHKLKLATPGAVSYASVEMTDLDYYKGCLLNWIITWEEELNAKLVAPLEQGRQFFKHNANAFLRGDFKTRQEGLAVMHDRGIINADQWLDLEDMNPQPGGQGKIYLVQGAMIAKDQLLELTAAKIESEKRPPPTPGPPAGGPSQQEVDDAKDRATRAEAAAAEAREALQREREARVALEATGTATAAELATLRESEQRLQVLATNATILAENLREQHEAAQAAAIASAQALAASEATGQARADEIDRLTSLSGQQVVLTGEMRKRADELQQAKEAAEGATREALAAHAAAETRAAEAAERAEALQVERDRAIESLEEATARAVTLAGDAEAAQQLATEASERAAAALTGRDALLAQAEEARQLAESLRADATAAREALTAAEAEAERSATAATTAMDAATRAQADLAQMRERDRAQRVAVIGANRSLILDAMGRMTRREVQQARAKQATPEKLRRWLADFPELHEAICLEALLPAVRVHLAWQGPTEDPEAVATTLVRGHIEAFVTLVRRALEGDPVEFHALLDRFLTKWEAERAATVADTFLVEAVRHVHREN